MNHLGKYAIIILAGIFLTFVWMLPVVAGGVVVGWLLRGKAEPYINLFKEVSHEKASNSKTS